ncbi:MAG: hypothetical protein Q4E06_00080 [Lautropia sp.]|nr:hypothetical protein [Lautropia sp.]
MPRPTAESARDILPPDGAHPKDGSRDFRQRLHTPTQITRLQAHCFIVDCWHHRILYSPRTDAPLSLWQALDENIAGPHSIASDGTLYVAEDTGRHGLKVYRQTGPARFEQVQYLEGIGKRPHRTIHDPLSGQFLVIGSSDQSLHGFAVRDGRLVRTLALSVPSLHGQYCRSITLHRGRLHFVGEHEIVIHPLEGRQLSARAHHLPLPDGHHGGNDLFFLDDRRGILSCTPGRAFLFDDLASLARGMTHDLSSAFTGTPYYISRFDGRLWIPEITEHSAIRSYRPTGNGLGPASTLFDNGPADALSLARKTELPT